MARRSHRRHTGRHGSTLANASRRVARARRVVVGMRVSRGGLPVIGDLGAPTARCEIKRTAVDVAVHGRVSRRGAGDVIVLHSAIPWVGVTPGSTMRPAATLSCWEAAPGQGFMRFSMTHRG
jgi:hypothetical protein